MKKVLLGLATAALLFTACEPSEGPKITESDKWYVTGDATYYTDKTDAAQLSLVDLDAEKSGGITDSEFLIGNFAYLKAGKSFLVESADGKIKMGGSNPETVYMQDNPDKGILGYRYSMTDGGAGVVPPAEGMYYIVYNTSMQELMLVLVNWGMIGDAVGGWSDELSLGNASYSDGVVTWEKTEVKMTADPFKFRYGGDWGIKLKVDAATEVVSFSDITGTKSEEENILTSTFATMMVGGKNLKLAEKGLYTVTLTYTISDGSYKAKAEKTGDFVLEYPETLYFLGDAYQGWDWTGTYGTMIQTTKAGKFWTLVYLLGGKEFKFSPVADWAGDFGVTGQATPSMGTFGKGSDNIKVPTDGVYQVVVDLPNNKITLEEPKVYLLGDVVGAIWGTDAFIPANLFTIDHVNGTLTSPAFAAAGNLRMCMRNEFLADGDWWMAEFNVIGGKVVYRAKGNDQEAVAVTAGQKATLNIKTGDGTIN